MFRDIRKSYKIKIKKPMPGADTATFTKWRDVVKKITKRSKRMLNRLPNGDIEAWLPED